MSGDNVVSNRLNIDDVLSTLNLSIVPIAFLVPNEREYDVLMLQHKDNVVVNETFIRNENTDLTNNKFNSFFQLADDSKPDLLITPEYSCPWQVLINKLNNGVQPDEGKLWIVGCESITPSELDDYKSNNQSLTFIYETVNIIDGKKFYDPVCIILWARAQNGQSRLVIAVQFKTQPMADRVYEHEHKYLIEGTTRYIIRNDDNSIRISAIICSDALSYDLERDLAQWNSHPYLIVHPQLNYKPRHNSFRSYRDKWINRDLREMEVICLNWAKGFRIGQNLPSDYGASSIFVKSDDIDISDSTINEHHRKGCYYAHSKEGYFSYYQFCYEEMVFKIRCRKINQRLVAAPLQLPRSGPKLISSYKWNNGSSQWEEGIPVEDGFCSCCQHNQCSIELLTNDTLSPLDKERLLCLCSGHIQKGKNGKYWHDVEILPSFVLSNGEISNRLIFTDDPDSDSVKRNRCIESVKAINNQLLTDISKFPEIMKELDGSWNFDYLKDIKEGCCKYSYNIFNSDNTIFFTFIFMGDAAITIANKEYDRLWNIFGENDRERVVLWYRNNGNIENIHNSENGNTIDKNTTEPLNCIDREE